MLSADSNWLKYDWCSTINENYLLHCCSNDISTNSNQLTASNEDLGKILPILYEFGINFGLESFF
jgi:hypothetical protein